jgi:hypothetical protein
MDIPGFYYDPEKKRYFKIEADRNVHGAHQHSSSSIDKLKRDSLIRNVEDLKLQRKKASQFAEPIKRCSLLHSPCIVSGTRLMAELSTFGTITADHRLRAYLDLFPSGDVDLTRPNGADTPQLLFRFKKGIRDRKRLYIDSFAWDEYYSGLHFTLRQDCPPEPCPLVSMISTFYGNEASFLSTCRSFQWTSRQPICSEFIIQPALHHGRQTSAKHMMSPQILLAPGKQAFVVGMDENNRTVAISSDVHPDSENHRFFASPLPPQPNHGRLVDSFEKFSTWTHNPFSEGPSISCATAWGDELHIDKIWLRDDPSQPLGHTKSDILSLEYISRHVIAAGCRNGAIALYDDRVRENEGSVRIKHGDPVNHIARTDNTGIRLIAAGGTMLLYDLRMVKDSYMSSSQYLHLHKRGRVQNTTPVLRFDYANSNREKLAFSACQKNKVVAAAQEDGTFRIYSMQTANTLASFQVPHKRIRSKPQDQIESRYQGHSPAIQQLQVVNDKTGGFRILVLRDNVIWNYGPQSAWEDEEITDMISEWNERNRNKPEVLESHMH